jgi:tRNA (cmo5U34)-methyltransferase
MTENRIRFDNIAKDWDKSDFRLSLAKNITDKILDCVALSSDDVVMDFGCGTGLVGLNIAPFVKKLIGADLSNNMLEAFKTKAQAGNLANVEAMGLEVDSDLSHLELDVIVSAMALHHIENPHKQFEKFSSAIKSGGVLAIADLAKEDGSFHENNSGVYHFGFLEEEFERFFVENGFEKPTIVVAHTVKKPNRDYDILLSYAKKK